MLESEPQIPVAGVTAAPSTKKQRRTRRTKATAARTKSETELLIDISAKLDRIVAVLAAEGKELNRQVSILASAGCDSGFIAIYTGKTPSAIRNLPGWRSVHSAVTTPTQEAV